MDPGRPARRQRVSAVFLSVYRCTAIPGRPLWTPAFYGGGSRRGFTPFTHDDKTAGFRFAGGESSPWPAGPADFHDIGSPEIYSDGRGGRYRLRYRQRLETRRDDKYQIIFLSPSRGGAQSKERVIVMNLLPKFFPAPLRHSEKYLLFSPQHTRPWIWLPRQDPGLQSRASRD